MKGKIDRKSQAFPEKIRENAPDVKQIYVDGDVSLLYAPSVAVVGCRKCTQYGKTVAKSIGKRMAQNDIVLVSGLARGIDTAGHEGALSGEGKTIAVLAGGTDTYYPPENKRLQQQIAAEGLLISEHPQDYRARAYDFPIRNRIISALSESVVIVEAPARSGALITAECAMEQGKHVYAVPGNITSYCSFGTNELIREGTDPLFFIDDILTDMGISPAMQEDAAEQLGGDEKKVFDVIKNCGEVTVDEIYHKTFINPSRINGIITVLEMKGIVFSALGKVFVAKF